jgi:hypothetical protein
MSLRCTMINVYSLDRTILSLEHTKIENRMQLGTMCNIQSGRKPLVMKFNKALRKKVTDCGPSGCDEHAILVMNMAYRYAVFDGKRG